MSWQEKIDTGRFPDGLESVVGLLRENSPYLATLIEKHGSILGDIAHDTLEAQIADLLSPLAVVDTDLPQAELKKTLRIAKAQAHLLIAIGDVAGMLSLDVITRCLSELAETTLNTALGWQLRDLDRRGLITLSDPARPQEGSGLIVLGMGKLGAVELNYSSDIDIIVFFEHDASGLIFTDPTDAVDILSKMVRPSVPA